jgi:NADH-ubiquinone oxidoreductase chain 2
MSILFSRIAIIALAYCFLQDLASLSFINKGIGLHGGLLHITNITQVFHIFVFIISILILQLTSFYPRKVWVKEHSSLSHILMNNLVYYRTKIINKMGEHLKIIEYPLILLFVVCGAIFLMSTNDLVSIFLSIELQSYGLYLLSTIYRNSELATTGGLMYFLLGGLSSCFILFGTSLLYANSGTTNMDGLYIITSISDGSAIDSWYKPYYINFSLLIFSIGFLFKVSAAPFHFWSPEVYDAIPTIVTTFVANIAKISIFILLLEIVYFTSNYFSDFNWTFGLLMSSLLSLIIGTVVGLTQFRIKRLLAYSTISHVGFMLLALSISSIESIQAFIFYLMQYSLSNLNVFIILVTIGFSFYLYVTKNKENNEISDKNNSPVQLISQLKGYFYVNPFLALSLAISIFSFAGIPPLLGFFAKQMVLSAALDSGYVFITLVAILTSVIGGVYYLNIVKEMFYYEPDYKLNSIFKDRKLLSYIYNKDNRVIGNLEFNHTNIVMSSPIAITISSITLVILLFMLMNKEWLSMGKIKLNSFISILNKKFTKYNKYVTYFKFISISSFILYKSYTTKTQNIINKDIHPWFITGFTDAEGSFMIHLEKNNDKWRIRPTFQIKLNERDLSLLQKIKAYFNEVGNININNYECTYKVRSLKDIEIIISHFDKYFLITQKRADFELFKEIINKLNNREHLELKGLHEIICIIASMNKGLSLSVKTEFSNIKPVVRPLIENTSVPHPEWMAGFVSGEGSFSVVGDKSVSLSFRVSQHDKDQELLKSFVQFFDCGYFNYHNKEKKAGVFIVRKFKDINSVIIPFFNEYNIQGVKNEDFKDWSKVAKILSLAQESKNSLTIEEQEQILNIKQNMNSYRV